MSYSCPRLVFTAVLPGILLLYMLTGCGPSAGPPGGDATGSGRLVVTGSSTIAPLVADVARRYESERPNARIDVQTGGSSRGLADVRRGLADIGMVSRSPRQSEDDVQWHPVALDGLALIVHSDNVLEGLTREQVVAVFRGEVDNWRDIGAQDAPITVVNKAEGRSTLEVFLDHFGLKNPDIRADVVIGDNQQAIKTVVGNPDAIAYVSVGTAEYEAAHGAPLRLLRLNTSPVGEGNPGEVPSIDTVRTGAYPVVRTLHVVTAVPPARDVEDFLAYLRSTAVHDLVESHFFVAFDGDADEPGG